MLTQRNQPQEPNPETALNLYYSYNLLSRDISDAEYLKNIIRMYPSEKDIVLEILENKMSIQLIGQLDPFIKMDEEFIVALTKGMVKLSLDLADKSLTTSDWQSLSNGYSILQKHSPDRASFFKRWCSTLLGLSETELNINYHQIRTYEENQEIALQSIRNPDVEDPHLFAYFNYLRGVTIDPEIESIFYLKFLNLIQIKNYRRLAINISASYIEHLCLVNPKMVESFVDYLIPELLEEYVKSIDPDEKGYIAELILRIVSGMGQLFAQDLRLTIRMKMLLPTESRNFMEAEGIIALTTLQYLNNIDQEIFDLIVSDSIKEKEENSNYLIYIFANVFVDSQRKQILRNPLLRQFFKDSITRKYFTLVNGKLMPTPEQEINITILSTLQDIAQAEEEAGRTPSATSI